MIDRNVFREVSDLGAKRVLPKLEKEVPNCVPLDEVGDDIEKDDDDPCWDGYVQMGTKEESDCGCN